MDLLRQRLRPARSQGRLYDLLVKWPFACYLTTNYDDELPTRLKRAGFYHKVLRNTKEDLALIRDGASRYVVKLHSDLDHPDELVLTSADYQRLETAPEGIPFRDKVRQIMEMFTVVIVGHSLSDADLCLVLKIARKTAHPEHPIYMIAANFTVGQEREYYEKYNIVLHSYPDRDGRHLQLWRTLAAADRWVAPRTARFDQDQLPVPEAESAAAEVLFIFRRLKSLQTALATCRSEYLGPLVLQALFQEPSSAATLDQILGRAPISLLRQAAPFSTADAVGAVLECLALDGFVAQSGAAYELTSRGRQAVVDAATERTAQEDQAYGQFVASFERYAGVIEPEDESDARRALRAAIVNAFRRRALALASAIFAGQSVRPEDLSDVFHAVSDAARAFPVGDLRAAFIMAAHQFLIEPAPAQKRYLESISQGYFLYHMVGLDPHCSRIRRDLFQRTLWIVDSSVLLPLLAVGCHNHRYAVDLFARLRSAGASVCITPRLLTEVWEHLSWAIASVGRTSEVYTSVEFMETALVKGSYKQNLFVDGFVCLAADGVVVTFAEYLKLAFPEGELRPGFEAEIRKHGLSLLDVASSVGSSIDKYAQLAQLQDAIQEDREKRGTFRSRLQVEAEAEVLHLITAFASETVGPLLPLDDFDRVYFVSTSRVLDRVAAHSSGVTWTPEALYRYVVSLPGERSDADLLQQCMLQEYFHAGLTFIDRSRYLRFFGPAVNSARLSFADQKEKYLQDVEREGAPESLDRACEATPDLEKPFFVSQMAWRDAERARRSAQAAEAEAQEATKRAE